MISDAALDDLKERHPVADVAGRWVTLRRKGKRLVGPCPICSVKTESRSAGRFEILEDGERWVCAVCQDGGDVIWLIQKREGINFEQAIEFLGGVAEVDHAAAAARAETRRRKREASEASAREFRERERETAYGMWRRGVERPATVRDYLARRALSALPAKLRGIDNMPYYLDGKRDADVIHRGPAMLAPVINAAGKFSAVHITWLDLARDNGKVALVHPDNGDPLPAKKVRGSKSGGHIELVGPVPIEGEPVPIRRLFIGEGIETVGAVWAALEARHQVREDDAFWSAVDLGNLAGKAAESIAHPTLKTETGRARRFPGPVPDLDAPAIAVPDSVAEVVILGDGDSDQLVTRWALARAAARLERDGRRVRIAMAPEGMDFNDLWRSTGDASGVATCIDSARAAGDLLSDLSLAEGQGEPRLATAAAPSRAPPTSADPRVAPVAPSSSPKDEASSRTGGTAGRGNGRGAGAGAAGDGDGLNRKLAWLPQTDLGNVERFVARWGHLIKWCPQIGWLFWDGKRWSTKGADAFVLRAEHATVRSIQEEARAVDDESKGLVPLLPAPAPEGKVVSLAAVKDSKADATARRKRRDALTTLAASLRSWGRKSEAAARLSPISKRARGVLEVHHELFDADPFLINVNNGTLVVRRPAQVSEDEELIVLKPHDPADLITKISPVDYAPKAACPVFDAFFAEVQPLERQRRFLLAWHGYSLTGDAEEQKLVVNWGTGRNGKGTFMEICAHIAGDYADSVPIETFLASTMQKSGSQASPDLAKLPGARYLRAGEPPAGSSLNEALIKRVTGGDPITTRNLNLPFFTFFAQFKLSVACNHKPRIKGGDDGIWGRMVLVPWTVFIPRERRDMQLRAKLKAEASGILNQLLDGLRDWLEHGLVMGEEIEEATAAYRRDSDAVGRFMEACTVMEKGARTQSSVLHEVYTAWAACNGEPSYSNKGLTGILEDRGYQRRQINVMFWIDVKLMKSASDFVDSMGKPITQGAPRASSDSDGDGELTF